MEVPCHLLVTNYCCQSTLKQFDNIDKEKTTFWTDPQKLDSLVRLARGIEFGNEPGLIPLAFVWFDHGCSSGYIPLAPL